MDAQRLIELRANKDEFFKKHPQSPLTPEQQDLFSGLTYYIPMPKLDMLVEVSPFEKQENVQIQTNTGEIRWYLRYGEFRFKIGGEEARLTIFKIPPDNFFLPFVDTLTEYLGDNRFHIDFNQAYNPFCAYSENYSCPLTPLENRLKVAIRAGEKLPVGEWVKD
jgi:uncharacterized protein (DUF1684 family)